MGDPEDVDAAAEKRGEGAEEGTIVFNEAWVPGEEEEVCWWLRVRGVDGGVEECFGGRERGREREGRGVH